MTNTLIRCEKIIKTYQMGEETVPVLRGIELMVQRGEQLAILGPSGSGKSTLMNILGCLDTPTSGSYYLDNREVSQLSRNQLADVRNHKIGFIFQSFNLLAHATALENVALPLLYRGTPAAERRHRAEQLLKRVELGNRMGHLPSELSGGQRQRVAIARALITNPDLLLADEPTGNLDSKTGNAVMGLFEELSREGKTVIIVTHDLSLAERTQRIIRIADGVIAH